MTANECAALLLQNDGYLLLSHTNPDGDTIGSGAALCNALRRAGKRAFCFNNPEITENYRPFIVPYLAPEGRSPYLIVSVDVASERMLPPGAPGPVWLAIDHHPSNSRFAERLCLAAARASCGELVLEIIRALGNGVTPEEASLLYMAVSTDTGCFQYANTDAACFRTAAELLELGADSLRLNARLFRTMSRARMALEGRILSGLRFFREGKISVALIRLADLAECGATENDCDDLAGLAGRAEGSSLSVTIREKSADHCKLSLRSSPEVNVSEICALLGGGGHAMAAGCQLPCGPEEALRRILAAIDEKWPES